MAIRDDIQNLKTLTKDELIDLRLELQIDRLTIDSDLKNAEDEGNDKNEWYNKATYAFKAKAIIMTAIDTEINRRKKDLAWEEVFHQKTKTIVSESIYDMIRKEATDEFNQLRLTT